MRALTVRQPWAWQIIHQRKNVENRTRNVAGNYRGPVAIHAALRADEAALRCLPARPPSFVTAPRVFHYGAILGVVDLIDVVDHSPSAFALPGHKHLVLTNPRPLSQPLPWRGALGLWTPPTEVVDRILESIAQATPDTHT